MRKTVIVLWALWLICSFPLMATGQKQTHDRRVAMSQVEAPSPPQSSKGAGSAAQSNKSEQQVLTNADVIQMVKSGFDEKLILNVIGANETQFDVSVKALINLKNAGVGQRVLDAMIAAGSAKRQPQDAMRISAQPTGAVPSAPPGSPQQTDDLYAVLVSGQDRQRLIGVHARLASVKLKDKELSSLASVAGSAVVGEAVSNVLSEAAARAAGEVLLSSVGRNILFPSGTMFGMMAGGIIYGTEKVTGKIFGRSNPTATAVFALERAQSAKALRGDAPQFEIFYGTIPGINPDEYEPAIVRLTVTKDNYRLRGAAKIKDSKISYEGFLQESVPMRVNKIARGHRLVEPESALAPGEYGLVLVPINPKKAVSGDNPVENALLIAVWDFSVTSRPSAQ